VLVSWRREARDVELGRNRIELLEKVRHRDGNEERLVLFHQVTGELEVPGGVAHGGHRDRIHAQGLHDRAVEHPHVAQRLGGHRARCEHPVDLGQNLLVHVAMLENRVEHSRGGVGHGVEARKIRPQHRRHQLSPFEQGFVLFWRPP